MVIAAGEILLDIFDNYSRIGGAPFNFVVHMKNFGFDVRFISRVGEDNEGRDIIGKVEAEGLDPLDIQVDPDHETGKVFVKLDSSGVPEFTIAADAAWDYISFKNSGTITGDKGTGLVYFGTLVQRTPRSFAAVREFLEQTGRDAVKFCDLNLRPGGFNEKIIKQSLHYSDVLKINRDEMNEIMKLYGIEKSYEYSMKYISEKNSIKTVILTDGADAVTLLDSGRVYTAFPEKLDKIADTVGAGDAFAAAAAWGILTGKDPETVLNSGIRLSGAVCGVEGALLQNTEVYEEIKQNRSLENEK
jgi:fructokinase